MRPTPRHVATKGSVSTLLPNPTPIPTSISQTTLVSQEITKLPLMRTRLLSASGKRVTACFLSEPRDEEGRKKKISLFFFFLSRWAPRKVGLWFLSHSVEGVYLNRPLEYGHVSISEKLTFCCWDPLIPVKVLFLKQVDTMINTPPVGPGEDPLRWAVQHSKIATCYILKSFGGANR